MSKDIKLKPHSTDSEFLKLLQARRSRRDFDGTKDLTEQELSDLLWVAYGDNVEGKEQSGVPHKVVPSALAIYPLKIFVFLRKGIYEYLSQKNELKLVKEGDFREKTGNQDFVKNASANLLFFFDQTTYENHKFKDFLLNPSGMRMASVDCGIVTQNICVFAALRGLKTVIRGSVGDEKELRGLCGLNDKCQLLLGQSIGH